MAAPTMRFTTFRSVRDRVPHPYEGWDSFSRLFELQVVENKHSVALYCGATYINERRLMENVLHVSFGIIDVDTHPEDVVLDALTGLVDDLDLQVIFHTTHSHAAGLAEGKYKCRIIIPFSRPVEMHEWDRVWAAMNALVNGIADTNCKNPNAIYYFPSCPPGAEDSAVVEIVNPDGDALDIDDLLEEAPPVERKHSFIPEVDEEVIKRIEASTRYQLAQIFIEKYPAAIEGQHGDSRTLKAAMIGADFGLTAEQFWPLFQQYNERCEPPWDENDLHKKLENAEKYRSLPFGWRLVQQGEGDVVEERHLRDLAKGLAKKSGRAGRLGRWLERATQTETITTGEGREKTKKVIGKPFGPEAEQIFDALAELLARKFEHAEPIQLALLLEKSIEATQTAGNQDISVDWMAQQIRTAQETRQTKNAEEQLDQQVWERNKIRDTFRTIGITDRTTPYTRDEIVKFAKDADLSAASEFNSRWIIQYGKRYYFFISGEYTRSHDEREAFNQAKDTLMLAKLPVHRDGPNGPVRLKMHELIEKYGSIASAVDAHLTATHSFYNGKTKTLVEAPRHPLRDLDPKHDERVEKWLRFMADDDVVHDKLLDWLATMPLIHKPTSCLFLHGEPRTGKTLIANGCTRLWLHPDQGGPTQLEDVTGNFNSMLFDHCPVVFGDEFIPSDFKGEPRTDLLRRLIQEHARTLRRKNIHDATLVGAIRLIVAANDPSIIVNDRKALTNHDISAINERFLCVPIKTTKAKEYLDRLSAEDNVDFFSGDVIPKHIWWLNKNRKVKHGPRLLVEGLAGSELEMRMMTGAGLRSEVCHWISNYVLAKDDKRNMTVVGSRPVVDESRDGEARLLVTAEALRRLWSSFNDAEKPSIGAIEKALGGVCATKRVKKGSDKYRHVNLLRVKHWAVINGVCSEEKFDAALAVMGLSCEPLDTIHTTDG